MTIDEDFEYFLEEMGPAIEKRAVPPTSIERYRGKLPDQLLSYWEEHGWCGYASGLFWTVDPEEYEPALEAWIGDTDLMEKDAYHVIAKGAFGDLFLWGENTGHSLSISAPNSFCTTRTSMLTGPKMDFGVRVFFSSRSRNDCDFDELFEPALKQLGPLSHDELYGFVPALALGGTATVEQLQKVKAVEHLVLLAQLAPLKIIDIPRA